MDTNQTTELTLEQDFNLRNFTDLVQQMSREQAQQLLVEQHKLMLLRDRIYQDLLKHEWQIDAKLAAL